MSLKAHFLTGVRRPCQSATAAKLARQYGFRCSKESLKSLEIPKEQLFMSLDGLLIVVFHELLMTLGSEFNQVRGMI
jgi:hypothetical protein